MAVHRTATQTPSVATGPSAIDRSRWVSSNSGLLRSGWTRESGTGTGKAGQGQVRYWQYGQAENSPDLAISDLSRFLFPSGRRRPGVVVRFRIGLATRDTSIIRHKAFCINSLCKADSRFRGYSSRSFRKRIGDFSRNSLRKRRFYAAIRAAARAYGSSVLHVLAVNNVPQRDPSAQVRGGMGGDCP